MFGSNHDLFIGIEGGGVDIYLWRGRVTLLGGTRGDTNYFGPTTKRRGRTEPLRKNYFKKITMKP